MIKIRLARLGAKKKPIYRVVVADVRNARTTVAPSLPSASTILQRKRHRL